MATHWFQFQSLSACLKKSFWLLHYWVNRTCTVRYILLRLCNSGDLKPAIMIKEISYLESHEDAAIQIELRHKPLDFIYFLWFYFILFFAAVPSVAILPVQCPPFAIHPWFTRICQKWLKTNVVPTPGLVWRHTFTPRRWRKKKKKIEARLVLAKRELNW